MVPGELKQLNIEYFQRLLLFETDPDKLAMIERLLGEERLKPDSAYPSADPDEPGRPTFAMRNADAHNATGGDQR
jgi:hypothetical protein